MPLIPAVVAAIAAGAALAKGIPAIMKTPQERANKKRIKELEAMGDAMGLTPAERKELEASYSTNIEAAQGATDRAVSAQLANGGGGSGQAVARAQASGQQTVDATTQAAREIAGVDRQRKAELEQELEDRYGFQSATRKARAAAIAEVPAAAATGYVTGSNHRDETGLKQQQIDVAGGAAGGAIDRAAKIAALTPEEIERLRALMISRGMDTSELPPAGGGT